MPGNEIFDSMRLRGGGADFTQWLKRCGGGANQLDLDVGDLRLDGNSGSVNKRMAGTSANDRCNDGAPSIVGNALSISKRLIQIQPPTLRVKRMLHQ